MPPIDPNHAFVRAVATALRRRCGVRDGARLLIAVSGGGDSVALAAAISALAPRRGWSLRPALAHVLHPLRKDGSAEEDAAFTARLAESLDLPFLQIALDAPPPGVNIEAWARHARYDALAIMARTFDAHTILTAHTADDQLETLLMRLLRGTSVRGLSGIAWRRRLHAPDNSKNAADDAPQASVLRLIRPMLGVTREQGRNFLREHHLTWREDPTNADTSRLRARLRATVLPAMAAIDPRFMTNATPLADHLRHVAQLMDNAIATAADRVRLIDGVATLDRLDARTLPRLILTGLVRRLALEAGAPADRLGVRTLTPITRAARDHHGGTRTFAIEGNITITIDATTLRVTRT